MLTALAFALRERGRRVVTAKEPGGTPAGERIRSIFLEPGIDLSPQAELLLVNASRAQLVREVIRPALAKGEMVLCDRYVDSSAAYQGYGRGLPLELVREVCDVATDGLVPDRTLLLDLGTQTSLARLRLRSGDADRVEREDEAFHNRVREGYLRMAREHPERFIRIDAEQSPAQVCAAALEALAGILV